MLANRIKIALILITLSLLLVGGSTPITLSVNEAEFQAVLAAALDEGTPPPDQPGICVGTDRTQA